MSRSHLYRTTGPSRPLLSIVLAAIWLGGGLVTLLAASPYVVGGTPLHGPAAALLERAFALLGAGAMLAGLATLVAEIVVGRTTLRGVRMLGALLLLAAGVFGSLDAAQRMLRPGTPVAMAADGPLAPAAGAGVDVAATDRASAAGTTRLASGRLAWSSAALVAAVLVLGGGLAALRDWNRSL